MVHVSAKMGVRIGVVKRRHLQSDWSLLEEGGKVNSEQLLFLKTLGTAETILALKLV